MTPFRPEDQPGEILASIVESSDDAIVSEDLEGVICSWNPGAERLFGYTADEIIGRPLTLILPADRRDELAMTLESIKAGQRVEHYETIRQTKHGHLVDVSVTVSPIRNAAGHIVGATAVTRDLTARRRADAALRTSELRWRSVVDSAVDGIIVIDAKGRIEVFNRGAERLFGYRASEVIGQNVDILMPSPYHEEHDGYLRQYLATGTAAIIGIGREVTGLRSDGTTFPVHLAVGEMVTSEGRKFTGILHDLSARMRIEEQLREQTALARLGQMAGLIAHEVKNPLAGVRGAIQVIGSRLPKDSKDAVVVKEIVTRIDALNELMTDLLVFARPPQPRPTPVDIGGLLAATAELLTSDPGHREVQVQVEGSVPAIVADADLLKIVFENLLVNSAQAMRGRGTIRVSLACTDDICHIAFSDSGPGIPADLRDKIFTPFFTTKARGSGLGLPTAKRLIEAHRGTISIACPPDGGTIVTVQLPAHDAAAPAGDEPAWSHS